MGRKRTSRIITIGGMAAIAALVGLMIALQIGFSANNDFKRSIDQIAFETIALTQEYQEIEQNWQSGSVDNSTITSTYEQYQLRYQQLIDRAEALDTPERYVTAKGHLIRSIELEMQSNEHFYNYLISGSDVEKQKADAFAQQSYETSIRYDAAIKEAG